jgi:hypothetical protein
MTVEIKLFSSSRLLVYWRHGKFNKSTGNSAGRRSDAAKLVGVLSDLRFEDVQSKVPLPLFESSLSLFHELQRIRSLSELARLGAFKLED